MVRIELDAHEAEVLRETLLVGVSELRDEIAKTDSQAFRDRLKEKRETLEKLLGSLGEG